MEKPYNYMSEAQELVDGDDEWFARSGWPDQSTFSQDKDDSEQQPKPVLPLSAFQQQREHRCRTLKRILVDHKKIDFASALEEQR